MKPYLVHSQPVEDCITIVEMRRWNLGLTAVVLGCLTFWIGVGLLILEVVR